MIARKRKQVASILVSQYYSPVKGVRTPWFQVWGNASWAWNMLWYQKLSKCSKIVRDRKQKRTPWPVWEMGYNISSKKKMERLHGSICTQMNEWMNKHFKSWGTWEHFLYRKILVTKCRGIKEIGNYHLTATIITTDLGKNHQWMLKSLNERSLVKRVSTCSKSCVINHLFITMGKG